MERIVIAILSMICCINVGIAQSAAKVYEYIELYKSTALRFEKEYGIPAAITLAQGILESGAGTSSLTKASNNHFCIKAGSGWNGRVYYAWDDETSKSRFRCYDSADESYRDYANLLKNSRYYRKLFDINVYDYRGWAFGLKRAGYATAPNYAEALIGIIDQYKLYAINGGVKLRPGKTVVITRNVDSEPPIFDNDCIADEEEMSDEQNIINVAVQKFVVEINRIHCTILQPGETLSSIARKHNISVKDLMKFNEVNTEFRIKSGDIVFLAQKKKKFEGAQDFYLVTDGETLYDVSQKFGIQLHQLAKLNKLDDYAHITAGTRLALK